MAGVVLALAGLTCGDGGPGTGAAAEDVRRGLHLRGRWEGVLRNEHGEVFTATLEGNVLLTYVILSHKVAVTDEGQGRLRLRWAFRDHLGIYHQEGDRLLIAFRDDSRGRPASFWPAGEGHHLLILRRVRPAK